MNGIDAATGKSISGIDHLRQSIRDILSTPIGSRVMRRDYGSRLFELVDRPVNPEWWIDAYMYTAEALEKWEPRLDLASVKVSEVADGQITIDLDGNHLPDETPIRIEGIVV